MIMAGRKLVLASGSPRRLALLNQIGIEPDRLLPVDDRRDAEAARDCRATCASGWRARRPRPRSCTLRDDEPELAGALILAADTVVGVGRRILPKAELIEEAAQCLRLLSGRSHRVYTAVCLVTPNEAIRQRLVETRVRFKRLSREDIEAYLASGEWRGKAGGYAVQGIAGGFVVKIIGSYTSVVGLPLYEVTTLLAGEGYPIRAGWLNAV